MSRSKPSTPVLPPTGYVAGGGQQQGSVSFPSSANSPAVMSASPSARHSRQTSQRTSTNVNSQNNNNCNNSKSVINVVNSFQPHDAATQRVRTQASYFASIRPEYDDETSSVATAATTATTAVGSATTQHLGSPFPSPASLAAMTASAAGSPGSLTPQQYQHQQQQVGGGGIPAALAAHPLGGGTSSLSHSSSFQYPRTPVTPAAAVSNGSRAAAGNSGQFLAFPSPPPKTRSTNSLVELASSTHSTTGTVTPSPAPTTMQQNLNKLESFRESPQQQDVANAITIITAASQQQQLENTTRTLSSTTLAATQSLLSATMMMNLTPAELATLAPSSGAQNFFKTRARTEGELAIAAAAGHHHHHHNDSSSDEDSLSTHSSSSGEDGNNSNDNEGAGGNNAGNKMSTQEQRLASLADDNPHSMRELLAALGTNNNATTSTLLLGSKLNKTTSGGAITADGVDAAAAAAGGVAANGAVDASAAAIAEHHHHHHHHHHSHSQQQQQLVLPLKLAVRGSRVPCGMITISARLRSGAQGGAGSASGVSGETELADELLRKMTGGRSATGRPTFSQITRAIANFGMLVVSGMSLRGGGSGGGGGGGNDAGGGGAGDDLRSGRKTGGGGHDSSNNNYDDDSNSDEEYGNFDIQPRALRAPNAYLLDHPGMMGVRRRKVVAVPCYRGSIIAFAGKQETAEDLDRQFLLRHPFCKPLNLKLSVIRTLKDTILQMSLRDGVVDVASVAYAVCYLERLILRRYVTSRSLHLVAATCLMIACKFNEDVSATNSKQCIDYVKHKCQELLGIDGADLMRAEIHVLVALKFELHVHETYVKRQWVRLLGSVNLLPAEYVSH